MQIVNGYVCMNCCDVDKARLGQDPHQSADQLKKQIEQRLDKASSTNFGPAVTFGGTLQANGANSAGGANDLPPSPEPAGTTSSATVNLVV
jgi:hypothetical protein